MKERFAVGYCSVENKDGEASGGSAKEVRYLGLSLRPKKQHKGKWGRWSDLKNTTERVGGRDGGKNQNKVPGVK